MTAPSSLALAALLALPAAADDRAPTFSERFTFQPSRPAAQGVPAARSAPASSGAVPRAGTPHVIAGVFAIARAQIPGVTGWDFSRVEDKSYAGSLAQDLDRLEKELDELNRRLPEAFDGKVQLGGPVDQINALFKKHQLQIELQEARRDPETVSIGVVMKLKDEWQTPGKERQITLDDGSVVKGARVAASFFENRQALGQELIAGLSTRGGLEVYMARYGKALPHDATSVWKEARALDSAKQPAREARYRAVAFPKVSFDSLKDVEKIGSGAPGTIPLKDVCTRKSNGAKPHCVDQFVLQQILKMDEAGFEASAGAGASFTTRGLEPQPYEIKGDFIVWVKVGQTIPFAAVITKKSMKDPKSS